LPQFADAGLHPVVLKNIELAQYDYPTPIQRYTMPAIIQGNDVLAIAQTGSGKTAAYMIPIVSKLMGKAKKLCATKPDITAPGYNNKLHTVRAEPLVVIVVPTRELAMQIFDEARRMCYRSMLRPCVVYGGLPMAITREQLGAGCDVLIATPGRLCDLMDKPHILTMSRVKYVLQAMKF
jgi:ATP-dependent RNA helicase DDX3X